MVLAIGLCLARYRGINCWSVWHYEGKKWCEGHKKIEAMEASSEVVVSNKRLETNGIYSKKILGNEGTGHWEC